MVSLRQQLRKYFIMGSQNCDCDRDPVEVLQETVSAGITAFQYREKGDGALTGAARLELGKQLKICASLVLQAGADGVAIISAITKAPHITKAVGKL